MSDELPDLDMQDVLADDTIDTDQMIRHFLGHLLGTSDDAEYHEVLIGATENDELIDHDGGKAWKMGDTEHRRLVIEYSVEPANAGEIVPINIEGGDE